MSKNCLITKLNGSVTDDSLPRFNIFKIQVRTRDDMPTPLVAKRVGFTIQSNVDSLLKVSSGTGYFSTQFDNIETDKLTEITLPENVPITIYCKYANYDLECNNASNIEVFITSTSSISNDYSAINPILDTPLTSMRNFRAVSSPYSIGNVEVFKDSPIEDILTIQGAISYTATNPKNNVSGDIGVISNCTGITSLRVTGTLISGKIEDLGKLTQITSMYLNGSKVKGDIALFIQSQVAHGRTECTTPIVTPRAITRCTVFGKSYEGSATNGIAWESVDKFCITDGAATIDDANKLFLYGYTSEEIAYYTNLGKTVVVLEE